MYLRNISRIPKPKSVRTLNNELRHNAQISSCSSISDDSVGTFTLYRPKYNPNTTRRWQQHNLVRTRFYATEESVDSNTFETVCEETLYSLAEYFEDLVASDSRLEKADVVYGAGVLTIELGNHGTYVINRQSPNKQIWLSSPTSGPKRFDYAGKEDCWIYKHDGQTLHSLLKREFESILGKELNISKCPHSKLRTDC